MDAYDHAWLERGEQIDGLGYRSRCGRHRCARAPAERARRLRQLCSRQRFSAPDRLLKRAATLPRPRAGNATPPRAPFHHCHSRTGGSRPRPARAEASPARDRHARQPAPMAQHGARSAAHRAAPPRLATVPRPPRAAALGRARNARPRCPQRVPRETARYDRKTWMLAA